MVLVRGLTVEDKFCFEGLGLVQRTRWIALLQTVSSTSKAGPYVRNLPSYLVAKDELRFEGLGLMQGTW